MYRIREHVAGRVVYLGIAYSEIDAQRRVDAYKCDGRDAFWSKE
jgi:hypothetical protein